MTRAREPSLSSGVNCQRYASFLHREKNRTSEITEFITHKATRKWTHHLFRREDHFCWACVPWESNPVHCGEMWTAGQKHTVNAWFKCVFFETLHNSKKTQTLFCLHNVKKHLYAQNNPLFEGSDLNKNFWIEFCTLPCTRTPPVQSQSCFIEPHQQRCTLCPELNVLQNWPIFATKQYGCSPR